MLGGRFVVMQVSLLGFYLSRLSVILDARLWNSVFNIVLEF